MEFEILVARFRKLHAVIFGLTESGKTKEELKEEFLVLERKIKDEARRDGALPNQLIQKIYDDFEKVRIELELTIIKAVTDENVEPEVATEEQKIEVTAEPEQKPQETDEPEEQKIEVIEKAKVDVTVTEEAKPVTKVTKKEKTTK
jgi:hypothetical protein